MKIRSWIIHKLGGITISEIPIHEKVRFVSRSIEPPQRFSYVHMYTVHGCDQEGAVEEYAKREAIENLIQALDKNGFVRYRKSNVDDIYDCDRMTVRKAIRADVWVTKMPIEVE